MTQIAKTLGILSLVGTLLPSVLFLLHVMTESAMKGIMLVSTVIWFVTAPLWMKGGDH